MSDPQPNPEPKPPLANGFKNWPWKSIAGIVALIVVVGLFINWLVVPAVGGYVERRTDLWLADARHSDPAQANPQLPTTDRITTVIADRLAVQLTEVQNSAAYHLTVTKSFFRYHYVTITIATTAAVLAGLLLVPISWSGWSSRDSLALKTAFLLFSGIAVLFSTYSRVYNQNRNISANAALYYAYLQLEDEMLSYVPRLVAGDTSVAAPVTLIGQVDARLGALRSLAIELDASQLPVASVIAQQLTLPTSGGP